VGGKKAERSGSLSRKGGGVLVSACGLGRLRETTTSKKKKKKKGTLVEEDDCIVLLK